MRNMGIFQQNISNEDLAELPLCRFSGKIIVVDQPEAIRDAVEYLTRFETIGFDTETRPTFKAGQSNNVALIQLSTDDRCYLFRICKTCFDKELLKLLTNKNVMKVGVDIKGDLRALFKLKHFKAGSFVDLQSIVGNYGINELSIRKMSAIVLGKKVSKAQRLSNWEASELTEAQQLYAATDAWVALEIYNKLMSSPRVACSTK